MRLYTLLKLFIQFMRTGIVSAKGGAQSTGTPQHFELINGVKICWGKTNTFKYGDVITLPYSYQYAFAVVTPVYNTGSTMRCSYDAAISGSKMTLIAYDPNTGGGSQLTNMVVTYIVIGV